MSLAISLRYEDSLQDIFIAIEEKREILVYTGMQKGFQDHEVLVISQELDSLVNQYYKMIDKVGEYY